MTTQNVGPWLILVVGVVALIAAVWGSLSSTAQKKVWLLWVFGLACAGVGTYGPVFLSSYGGFLNVLQNIQTNPSTETYASALGDIASGKLKPEEADAVLQYIVNKPVEGTDSLLSVYAEQASDPGARQYLAAADSVLVQRKRVSNELIKNLSQQSSFETSVEHFDPTTRALIARQVLANPGVVSPSVAVNRDKLREWAKIAPAGNVQK